LALGLQRKDGIKSSWSKGDVESFFVFGSLLIKFFQKVTKLINKSQITLQYGILEIRCFVQKLHKMIC